MADDYQDPSLDPGDEGTLAGVLRTAFRKMHQQTDDMLPARVVAFDRASNRVTLQPMIKMVGTQGQEINRAQVVSVPVYRPGGGGFHVSFPIKVGDMGYIKAMDRDISLWRQGYQDAVPNTDRMKSFEDAIFFPDQASPWAPASEDNDGMVISSTDGSVKLVLNGNGLQIVAAGKVEMTADGGFDFTGGEMRHNGKNIGDSHVHGGVEPGGANTSVPSN